MSARLGTIYTLAPAELKRLDPLICAIEDDSGRRPCVVFNRIGTLRQAESKQRRSLVLHDVFERSRIRDSVNVDLITHGGPARLCVSYDRPTGGIDRALAVARLLVPAFEAGARVLARDADPPLCNDHGLTARELEVARLVVARLRNLEIASLLGISAHTVRHHIENVFAKLDVRSRHDVAARLRGG
ncbi:MAG TPA: helix-turn-helix transcriptional regulator [Kofleriaceae bacterium]|nr:helix-turn-helix transcriptional regulator [Kofleriaceae bacterium]